MRFGLLLILLLNSAVAMADLTVAPRYEYIQGTEEELANRLIVKGKLNSTVGPFGIFVEGFGEFEGNEDQAFVRRSPSHGYLQEAYFEFNLDSFYVRVGRQALRWSESWTVPSLDVWTGRRWNRLFFDPLADQLTHSTGVVFSYARETYSLEFVGVGELAESYYPVPIPQPDVEENTSFGGRVKWNWGNFAFSALTAQVLTTDHYGVTGNYAFENAVPKFELGYVHDRKALENQQDRKFATLGCDIFWGNWILLTQVSRYETLVTNGLAYETSYYLTGQWNPNRHDVQLQAFYNPDAESNFGSFSYGYNITDYFTVSGFVQNYAGVSGLYKIYEEITGGTVVGLRLELSGNLAF
ncbi:hypothetical protein AZI87_03340 [Bdellovibrio bacteriovorus]|uniref:Porin domain-containing protein n=1 Tax=Bdellovibrio bacteriovorus TaxID=959 RepID=A0A162GJI1_BDEBC|nr:hypothetical protein [Bdellovibrio bacteriovorus]KYG68303.1 hypothetical protein AZI87_03340 [Bdellovibrio bacteriovorus]